MSYLLDLLAASAVVLLVASGLVVTYGWGGLINMAHGDLVMVGAYICASAVSAGIPFWLAVPLAGIAVGAVLLVADIAFFKNLSSAGLTSLLTTWGLGLVLSEGIRIALGPGGRFVDPPVSGLVHVLGSTLPAYQIVVTVLAVCVCVTYIAISRWSTLGLRIRAIVEAPQAALLLGVDSQRGRMGFVLTGGALAGLAGALIAPTAPVNPNLGPTYAATAFTVVLMSGNRVSAMPILAALFLGGTRILTQSLLQPAYAAIATPILSIAAVLCFQMRLSRS